MCWRARPWKILVCIVGVSGTPLMAQENDTLGSGWGGEVSSVALPEDAGAAESRAGYLLWLREHPYDLNTVTAQELVCLPGITSSDASAVIAFRNTFRTLTSLEQLRLMTDAQGDLLVEKLRPYVRCCANQGEGTKSYSIDGRFRCSRRTGKDNLIGSPWRSMGKLHMSVGDERLDAGITYEKDAGEPMRYGDVRGGATFKRPVDWMEAVVLGDFAVEAGQGLVFWRGNDYRAGDLSPTALYRRGRGVKVQMTTDDVHLLRGAAVTWIAELAHVRITGIHFLSSRALPGSVDSTGMVTSLFTTGAYTTEQALRKKDALHERLVGTRIACVTDRDLSVGVSWYRALFSRPFLQIDGGTRLQAYGVDWTVRFHGLRIFGETARSADGTAWVAGAACDPEGIVSWGFHYRNYGTLSSSFHGQGGGSPRERGVVGCLEVEPYSGCCLSAFVDLFASQERTAASPLPVRGTDVSLQAAWRWRGPIELTARLRRHETERCETLPGAAGFSRRAVVRGVTQHLSLKGVMRCAHGLTVAARLEGVVARPGATGARLHSSLLAQSVRWEGRVGRLESQMTFYRADAFETRFTVFESPLPGASTLTVLYGRGWRWSGAISLWPVSWVSCTLSATLGFNDERVDPWREHTPAAFQREIGLQIGLNWP